MGGRLSHVLCEGILSASLQTNTVTAFEQNLRMGKGMIPG